uniref:Uncharacterized protein n=1 Tax=Arundo donax TaxID=35708 RepID=A0A0A8ZQ28_ARUDO
MFFSFSFSWRHECLYISNFFCNETAISGAEHHQFLLHNFSNCQDYKP